MLNLRPYQSDAIDAVFAYWGSGGGNPLVDMATGLGKSVVIAEMTRRLIEQWPGLNVLMLVHVKELVEQNFKQLVRLWPQAMQISGVNSAGLGRRDRRKQILFASIQSVFRDDAWSLNQPDLVIVDEAHLVPSKGAGMYRQLLHKLRHVKPDLRVVGFTATPYRLDSGRLDGGDDALFNDTVYSYGIGAGIRDGWLSPLMSKASLAEIDVSGVAKRGGEFVAGALEAAADVDEITQRAALEISRLGADRRSWLAFCTGVDHAHHVRDAIRALGFTAETITGETPAAERTRWIAEFKAGRIRCLTNANVLTTGFDAPAVDLVAFLRPTLSTGLYVQMAGRGTRLADGKDNCLVLDFAGNVRRHGPVDTIEVKPKRSKGEAEATEKVAVDDVKAKTCPTCESLVAIRATSCPHCGYEWPAPVAPIEQAADATVPILSSERLRPVDLPVITWRASRWSKPDGTDSVRVEYFAGVQSVSEWVCPEHHGFAGEKAARWWRQHGGCDPAPISVADTLGRWAELTMPQSIRTRQNGKWLEVVGRVMPYVRFRLPADWRAAE